MSDITQPEITENTSSRKKKQKTTGIIIIIVLLITTIAYVIHWWYFNQNYAQTDNAQIDGHIAYISSKVSGKVENVMVDDYQNVKKGDLLVQIDPKDYEIELKTAQANLAILINDLKVAEEELISSNINASTSVDLASNQASSSNVKIYEIQENQKILEANLDANKASMEEAKNNLERFSFLTKRKSTTQLEYDRVKATYDVAKAKYNATLAQIDQNKKATALARSDYNTAKSNINKTKTLFTNVKINKTKLDVIKAKIEQAETKVENAQLKLSYAQVFAPLDGYIGKKSVEIGQVIQPSQSLMVIVPDNNIWVTANYKETQLENIKIGQPVQIKVDAYPSYKFTGTVERISPATGARFSLIPPDNASGNFTKVVQKVPVKIIFDKIDDESIHLVPGMNVVTTINISGK
ncbi:MAG: HlyD family secretion protein [Vampirovibrionia bacterium]